MRILPVLIVALVFASSALLAEPASAQSTFTVTGRICAASPYSYAPADGGAGQCQYAQGLPDAVVTLSRPGTVPVPGLPGLGPTQSSATTDATGDYRIEGLASGDYTFAVTRTGFSSVSEQVSLSQSQRKDALLQGQSVEARGQVVDAKGAGIANAQVSFCCSPDSDGVATSSANGAFAVRVTAGYLSVSVQAPGFQSFYDSRLVDGASDLQLQLERIPASNAKVTGIVRDQDGNAVDGARVAVSNYGGCYYRDAQPMPAETSAGSSEPASDDKMASSVAYPCYGSAYYGENYTFTDAQGRYALGAYAGSNTLSASKEGHAYVSVSLFVDANQTATQDVQLLRFPEKTARIEGRIVDASSGKGVRNAYLNVQSPEYGLYECSSASGSSGSGSAGSTGTEPAPALSIAPGEPYPSPGCAITIEDDGSFSGLVTPGYAIVSVWVDWYSSCAHTQDADGSSRSDCGPEYYSWSTSRVLAADDTTRIDVRLRARPAPDAEVSGYILDDETGKALPGAQISFSNQDTYGWGSATTDQDGSYRILLRSGYHTVSVWAEGHLRWEGVVDIAKGDTPFDVQLQPGTESYGGGCCYAYAEDSSVKSGAGIASMSASSTAAPSASNGFDGDSASEQYQDLGGGLGPYNAAQREAQLQDASDGAPGVGLVALLAALGAVLLLRRRTV